MKRKFKSPKLVVENVIQQQNVDVINSMRGTQAGPSSSATLPKITITGEWKNISEYVTEVENTLTILAQKHNVAIVKEK